MTSNVFAATTGFYPVEGAMIGSEVIIKSDTRAVPAADPNNRLEYMKAIVQTANLEGETIPLREVIPFWFAVSSPLLGMLLGLLGAWFVTWLSA
jgi:hypothetical protein